MKRRETQLRQEMEEEARKKAVADAQAAAAAAAIAAAAAAAQAALAPPLPVIITPVAPPAASPPATAAPPLPAMERPLSIAELQMPVPPRPSTPLSSGNYVAAQGFFLMWDFATGIPNQCDNIQITYRLMKDGAVIPAYPAKSTPSRTCSMVPATSMSLARTMTRDAQKICIVGVKKQFPKIPIWPSLRLIMELQRCTQGPTTSLGTATPSTPSRGGGGMGNVQSLGWTVLDLFLPPSEQQIMSSPPNSDASRGTFNAGTWRLPLYRLPIDPNATQDDIADNYIP
jgi:hypothetical protein